MQTKKQSLIESITNVAIGYLISLFSLFIIFPLMGIESSTGKNLLITLYFTLISIARSYILRRYFNKKDSIICQCKRPIVRMDNVEYCAICGKDIK